ncbi:hypothetical protein TBK1r_15610 [Stieleria magnilauensis]|uniref:Uncharacterized protein n=1 Tax=Stieleria magnilauensis TaxID=2527963 RepID=A0ABX5XNS9_9BACT|nr:hypothetical protein TBK1r_15610 [Planctomycetes bacterium TBK1r]
MPPPPQPAECITNRRHSGAATGTGSGGDAVAPSVSARIPKKVRANPSNSSQKNVHPTTTKQPVVDLMWGSVVGV